MSKIEPECSEDLIPIVDRDEFNAELQNYYSAHSIHSKKLEWTNDRVQSVIKLLEDYNIAKSQGKRPTNKQYHHASKYDIANLGDQKVLIVKRKKTSQPVIQIIPLEEYYQTILEAHIATGHGRRDKVAHALRHKYMIPIFAIKLFLNLCKTCTKKSILRAKQKSNGLKTIPVVLKPMITHDFNQSGLINIVDFQICPDGEYKWLMWYQDYSTKFSFLRPLKSKTVKDIAIEVLKIFLEVGCPNILQCDQGLECTTSILKEISTLWPTCEAVHGHLIHSSDQESIETSKQDIKNMIHAWMVDNSSGNWSLGCYFVQFQLNSSYQLTTENTPYKALFGVDPKQGLSSACSENIVTNLEVEVKMEEDYEDVDNNESETSPNEAEEQQV